MDDLLVVIILGIAIGAVSIVWYEWERRQAEHQRKVENIKSAINWKPEGDR